MPAVRRAADLRAAQSLRDEPGQHAGGRRRAAESLKTDNVKLLADLFHMNIEEADLAAAIRAGGSAIGHVHFADSNRRPAGRPHRFRADRCAALRDIGYAGYVSAECLPLPDSDAAAARTIRRLGRAVPVSYLPATVRDFKTKVTCCDTN